MFYPELKKWDIDSIPIPPTTRSTYNHGSTVVDEKVVYCFGGQNFGNKATRWDSRTNGKNCLT